MPTKMDSSDPPEADSGVYGGEEVHCVDVMEGYVEDEELSDTSFPDDNIFDQLPQSPAKANKPRKKFSLASHISKIQEAPPIYFCTACKSYFCHKSTVRNHEYCISGEKPYKCSLCDRRFMKKYDRDNHYRIHTGEKPFECSICQKSFQLKHKLNRHIKSHVVVKGDYKCEACNRLFYNQQSLRKHEVTKHNGNNNIQCKNCRKFFQKIEDRTKHCCTKKPKKKLLVCETCGKTFGSKWNLVVHQQIHVGQRPYKCEVCKKAFRLRQHRDRHATKHQAEADFECTLCKQTFGRKDNMIRHLKLNHPDRHLGIAINEIIKSSRRVGKKRLNPELPKALPPVNANVEESPQKTVQQESGIVILKHLPNIRFAKMPDEDLIKRSELEAVPEILGSKRVNSVLNSATPGGSCMSDTSNLKTQPSTAHNSVIKLASSFPTQELPKNSETVPDAGTSVGNNGDNNMLLRALLLKEPARYNKFQKITRRVEKCTIIDRAFGRSVIRSVSEFSILTTRECDERSPV